MPSNQNNFLYLLLAFAAGFMVGSNWPQIKTKIEPLFNSGVDKFGDIYAQLARMIGEQKEAFDDRMAERKTGQQNKAGGEQAEFVANLAQMMAGANQAEIMSTLSQMMANGGGRKKTVRKARPKNPSQRKRTAEKAEPPQAA